MDVRAQAALVIGKLLQQDGSLATLLPGAQIQVADNDSALLQELCYGTARWYPKLQCYLDELLEKPLRNKDSDIHGLLLVGLYQLVFLRTPTHAVLDNTVTATKPLKKTWAKNLVNGVLREFLRQQSELDQVLTKRPAFTTAHPNWLNKRIQQAWPDHSAAILAANNAHPPFTLRVNQRRVSREDYLNCLSRAGIEATKTLHSRDGVTLEKACSVAQLPGFQQGDISVQDESPQLTADLMQLAPGQRVLDACAAPGGKTAHLLETQPEIALTALDISERRLQRVTENVQRIGMEKLATLVCGDASQPSTWWDGKPFDRLLLDAPCSATGIIRRQPDIKMLRTPAQIEQLCETQASLMDNLWPLLAPGGLLLYATCSILPSENSEQVQRFLNTHPDAVHRPIDAAWGLDQTVGRQLLPQMNGHDGFYYATISKQK
ncbi:16S rRNA (cytosine(967)-C(5))-methyltransferase RsmB [Aurantivibrio plasticivorans]